MLSGCGTIGKVGGVVDDTANAVSGFFGFNDKDIKPEPVLQTSEALGEFVTWGLWICVASLLVLVFLSKHWGLVGIASGAGLAILGHTIERYAPAIGIILALYIHSFLMVRLGQWVNQHKGTVKKTLTKQPFRRTGLLFNQT